MNRPPLIMLLFVGALGFALAGGIGTVVDARKASEKNARIKDINATVNKGIDTVRKLTAEQHYLSIARELVDLPPEWRHSNYAMGSCVHATTESLLEWQGLHEQAAEWRRRYSGGEATAQSPHTRKMDAMGLKYVVANGNDTDFDRFANWAVETRRGFGVAHPRGHCVAVIGKEMHDGYMCAVILDNNHTSRYDYFHWDKYIQECKQLGGHAFAFVYDPPPPTPH